jgi:hypothetical protein
VFGNDDNERDVFKVRIEGWVEGIRERDFRPVEDRSFCFTRDFRRFCRYAPAEKNVRLPSGDKSSSREPA